MKNYYSILEVLVTASPDDIKRAYRRLTLQYHPDRNPHDSSASNKFKEVLEAYQILSNPSAKREYDVQFSIFTNRKFTERKTQQQTQHQTRTKTINPFAVKNAINEVRKRISGVNKDNINQPLLYKTINDILTYEHIDFIVAWNNKRINCDIVEDVMFCFHYLSYPYIQSLSIKLARLAGTDNDLIQTIYKADKRYKLVSYWTRFKEPILAIGILLFLVLIYNWGSGSTKSDTAYNRPDTGTLSNPESSESNDASNYSISANNSNISNAGFDEKEKTTPETFSPPKDPYADWDRINLSTGSSPLDLNFTPRYDYSLDNRLEVHVGSHTDVVLKLIAIKTNSCIRYVYIRAGETYNIRNIPQGRYFTKIAYGSDWRQKTEKGKLVGKFVKNSLYKKGVDIMDFNKVYQGVTTDGDNSYTNYSVPSFQLSLDVIASQFEPNSYKTNSISEDEFNQ